MTDSLFISIFIIFFLKLFNDSYHACVVYQQQLCNLRQFFSHSVEMDNRGSLFTYIPANITNSSKVIVITTKTQKLLHFENTRSPATFNFLISK